MIHASDIQNIEQKLRGVGVILLDAVDYLVLGSSTSYREAAKMSIDNVRDRLAGALKDLDVLSVILQKDIEESKV